jgi:hypothetical protein
LLELLSSRDDQSLLGCTYRPVSWKSSVPPLFTWSPYLLPYFLLDVNTTAWRIDGDVKAIHLLRQLHEVHSCCGILCRSKTITTIMLRQQHMSTASHSCACAWVFHILCWDNNICQQQRGCNSNICCQQPPSFRFISVTHKSDNE